MATSVVHPTESLRRPVFERPAVRGGARLRYEWYPLTEQTRLVQQWVRPPLYINKAYHEKGWALSQMMSPTGGLLQDDVLEIDVELGAGSRAALISPAACAGYTACRPRMRRFGKRSGWARRRFLICGQRL